MTSDNDKGENWMTVEDFRFLAQMGAIGPDDGATFYIVLDSEGKETEIAFEHPREIPPHAIGVMYYGK